LVTALEPGSALEGLASWFDESGEVDRATTRAQRRQREQASRVAADALRDAESELRGAEAEVERLRAEVKAAERRVQRARTQRQKRADDLAAAEQAADEL
jgi:hypothetical protein